MERWLGSLRLDVSGSDYLAPLVDFRGDEFFKISRRTGRYDGAELKELRFESGVDEGCVGFAIEFIDDLGRRVLRRGNAVKGGRVIAWDELGDGRDIGQHLLTHCTGDCQRAKPAVFDVTDGLRDGAEGVRLGHCECAIDGKSNPATMPATIARSFRAVIRSPVGPTAILPPHNWMMRAAM